MILNFLVRLYVINFFFFTNLLLFSYAFLVGSVSSNWFSFGAFLFSILVFYLLCYVVSFAGVFGF